MSVYHDYLATALLNSMLYVCGRPMLLKDCVIAHAGIDLQKGCDFVWVFNNVHLIIERLVTVKAATSMHISGRGSVI